MFVYMDLHNNLWLKGVVTLKVVQDVEVLKDILSRLNNHNFVLYDCYDNSHIILDDRLADMIKNYYDDMLNIKTIDKR